MDEARQIADEFLRATKVRLVFADQNGLTRGKVVPKEVFQHSLENGIGFATSIFAMDIEGETIPETGLLWERGDPDFVAKADLSTLAPVPWKPQTAQVIVEGFTHEGKPFFAEPRQALKRILALYSKAGFTAQVASELEFYLLNRENFTAVTQGTQAYSILHLVEVEKLLEDFDRHAAQMGIPLEAMLSEYAPGQFEINLRHEEALKMADHTFLFRNMVKEAAKQAGSHATFMAKPFADSAGSSFHLHVSLWRGDQNAFAVKFGSTGSDLAVTLRHFLGGCQRYLNAAMAFFAPNVNSYKRLRPGSYAPINDSWGVDNRTVSFRVPDATGSASRLEIRIPGADANPYYVIAAALATGWLGLQEKIEPSDPVTGNAYALPATVPRDLFTAIEELEKSGALVDLFGSDLVHVYSAVKRAEWRKYISTITEWEKEKYMKLI